MELIDLDALKWVLKHHEQSPVPEWVARAIDAQPVIACETCEHYDDNFYCRRKGEKYWVIRHDDFGCAFYDQKEQP